MMYPFLSPLLFWLACAADGPTTSIVADPPNEPDRVTGSQADECSVITNAQAQPLTFPDFAINTRTRCSSVTHELAAGQGMTLVVNLEEWQGLAHVAISTKDGSVFFETDVTENQPISFEMPFTGAVDVTLSSDQPEQPEDYGISFDCTDGCDQAYTRYPIVLMHGMAGTDSFFDVLGYFNGVELALNSQGYLTSARAVDPLSDSDVRGQQWVDHLYELQVLQHTQKFNLVGHSQGGLDARWVAHFHPEMVASVTTIATPHAGSSAIDLYVGTGGVFDPLLDSIGDFFGDLYGANPDQDLTGQLTQMSTLGSQDYNDRITDAPSVAYFSWGGATCQLLDLGCILDRDGEIVEPFLAATHLYVLAVEGDNDGLVSVESARWGTDLGVLNADHLDQVGLFVGDNFDHIGFFLDEAERLHDGGW